MAAATSGVIGALARQLAHMSYSDLPAEVVARLKHALIDFLGVALFGAGLHSPGLAAYAKAAAGQGRSRVIGSGELVSSAVAAAVNAQRAYDTDFDEAGPGNHAFSPIAATALAIAEQVDCDGQTLLTAFAVAYQLNGKFHRNLIPSRSAAGIRHLPLNSALCAGKLLGLDGNRLEHAMELAWMLAPAELDEILASRWWPSLGQGNALLCQAGIAAAELAGHGIAGPLGLIETGAAYDFAVIEDFSSPRPFSYVVDEMHLKPWIGSRATHPAIELVGEIAAERRLTPDDIKEIVVWGRAIYMHPPFNVRRPEHWRDAVSSLPWSIAMAILGVESGPDWVSPERLRDETARRLAQKVRIEEDVEATAIWRSGQRSSPAVGNTVSISAHGRTHRKSRRVSECLGSPARPMTWDQVARKFTVLATPTIGTHRSNEAVRIVDGLEALPHVRDLMTLLTRD